MPLYSRNFMTYCFTLSTSFWHHWPTDTFVLSDFDRDEFDYVEDLSAAFEKKDIAKDILAEQEKVNSE